MLRTKLPLFLCFFYSLSLTAQSQFNTNGHFSFVDSLPIPENHVCGPGQLTKNDRHFILGLTSGHHKLGYDINSNLYRYDLKKEGNKGNFESLALPNAPDSLVYFHSSASKNDEIIIFVVNEYGGWTENELVMAVKQKDGRYGDIRYLSEINTDQVSEAYPWISEDGLRLYFSRDFTLYYTERATLNDSFSVAQKVLFTNEMELQAVSCWLTSDEKVMFIIANKVIYRSIRNSKTELFPNPEIYTEEFKDFHFISGLSFTRDGKTAFLYFNDTKTKQILKYTLKNGKAW